MRNARQLALDVLVRTSRGDKPLDFWLDEADNHIRHLNRADRALLHALVYGSLRWQARLDHVIDQLARRPAKIDPLVRGILRMALFQMDYMDRIPDRAVVHSAVELAKANGRNWATGFVNGLLRRAPAAAGDLQWPDPVESPDQALAVQQSFPLWMVQRWIRQFGLETTRRLCRAVNLIPALTLRTNTLKTDRAALLARIRPDVAAAEPGAWSPDAIALHAPDPPMPQWPAYREGWFQVQGEAAQLVSCLLAPLPGERVWDACAGLGTKTAHLAQLMEDRGTILATDAHELRLRRSEAEMRRLGITSVIHLHIDLMTQSLPDQPDDFDRILLDAPCSGMGVLQKNPDGKWRTAPETPSKSGRRQGMLLEQVACRLRPGGRLVYAVCSFEPEENECVVEAFLQRHPEFAIDTPQLGKAPSAARLLTPEGFLKTLPHHQMDGFFAAALLRTH